MRKREFSNSLYVAEMRYIQAIHEIDERKNPDCVVGQVLPLLRRWRCKWLGARGLAQLRADPFYYYLLARTQYYDGIFVKAVESKMGAIINIGCGTDTRAYRFKDVLKREGVKILECDQPEAILIKQIMIRGIKSTEHVTYLPIDLNDHEWPAFEQWLVDHDQIRMLVYMEGVSPYINRDTFIRFLGMLPKKMPRGSKVAYDYKIRGVFDAFGRGARTEFPFRLGREREEVASFHEKLGYRLCSMERSADPSTMLLAYEQLGPVPLFDEDVLVLLEVR